MAKSILKSVTFISIFILINRLQSQEMTAEVFYKKTPYQVSKNGIYLYLINEKQFYNDDSNKIKNIDYFIIKRIKLKEDNNDTSTTDNMINLVRKVENESQLSEFFKEEDLEQFAFNFNLNNKTGVLDYFKAQKHPEKYFLYYQSIEMKRALGHVFLDKTAKPGISYIYNITCTYKDGKQIDWGSVTIKNSNSDLVLKKYHPKFYSRIIYDSVMFISWYISFTRNEELKNGLVMSKENGYNPMFGSNLYNSHAILFKEKNGNFIPYKKILSTKSRTDDTMFYHATITIVPNSTEVNYLQMEDNVYNLGGFSDTVLTYCVTQKFIPLLEEIKTIDTVDAVKISWKKPPNFPFIKAVQIAREYSDSGITRRDTMPLVNINDSFCYDYKLQPGQKYSYFAKFLYHHSITAQQKTAATATGSYVKFSRPNTPTQLEAANEGKHIRLNWNYAMQNSFYGFFLYRGTSPNVLSLVTGKPIKTTTYLDTAAELSPRSTYYYRVLTQNLRQDTSIFSDFVSITPNRPMNIATPADCKFYYANGKLFISWEDVRVKDNAVTGYHIYKRNYLDSGFHRINKYPLSIASFEDSMINIGDTILYKLASISYRNDSAMSDVISQFVLPKKPVALMNEFVLKNVENGLMISVPNVAISYYKNYHIYRREAGVDYFEKIATIPANAFEYIDKNVATNKVYVYAIAIEETDNRIGNLGDSKSIRRD